jgi:hypothetical protein
MSEQNYFDCMCLEIDCKKCHPDHHHYECFECCDTFHDTTDIETCPVCGSNHVSDRYEASTEEI